VGVNEDVVALVAARLFCTQAVALLIWQPVLALVDPTMCLAPSAHCAVQA
jgi:hypothetical protein